MLFTFVTVTYSYRNIQSVWVKNCCSQSRMYDEGGCWTMSLAVTNHCRESRSWRTSVESVWQDVAYLTVLTDAVALQMSAHQSRPNTPASFTSAAEPRTSSIKCSTMLDVARRNVRVDLPAGIRHKQPSRVQLTNKLPIVNHFVIESDTCVSFRRLHAGQLPEPDTYHRDVFT